MYILIKLQILFVTRNRRDSGFVGIGDMGPDLIKKPQMGNKDEPMHSPMQSRRQSRMFSIDFDCLEGPEEQDRIVKKYTQVGQEKLGRRSSVFNNI